MKIKTEHEH